MDMCFRCFNLLGLILASFYLIPASGFAHSGCCASTLGNTYSATATRTQPLRKRETSCYQGGASSPSQGLPHSARDQRNRLPWHSLQQQRQKLQHLPVVASAVQAAEGNADNGTTSPSYDRERSPGRPLAPHDPEIQRFEEWAKQAGFGAGSTDAGRASASTGEDRAPRLLHADFEGLRGLMAEDAVAPWQPLATLPMSFALTEFASLAGSSTTTPTPPPPGPLSVEAWSRCPWWVRLGVQLLKEKTGGAGSRLSCYMDILPAAGGGLGGLDTPLHWSDEQLDRVYYPRLLTQVAVQRRLFAGRLG